MKTAIKSADLAFLNVHFRMKPGDTQIWPGGDGCQRREAGRVTKTKAARRPPGLLAGTPHARRFFKFSLNDYNKDP